MTVLKWRASDLKSSALEFHKNSGLLDGGILVLAGFMLITALINRNALYLLFAAWLVVNLRMASLSAGWDTQWWGYAVPVDWVARMRAITLATYYVSSLALFKALFRDPLEKIGSLLVFKIVQWTCVPLLLLSMFASYRSFLPFLWPNSDAFVTQRLSRASSRWGCLAG